MIGRLLLVVALTVGATSPRAQNLPRNTPWQLRQLRTVFAERGERFLAAWRAADEGRRTLALRLLDEERDPAAPAGATPGLPALDAATRVLGGADPGAVGAGSLARFADSLDLEVVPGAFPPAAEGRGTPVTVRVYQLHPAELETGGERVELSLVWIGPDGKEEPARDEPFPPSAFAPPGFDVYVRAPLSAPGSWRLSPELRLGGEAARGVPVEVACVRDVARRVAALAAGAKEPEDADDDLGDLVRLLGRGLRFAHALGPEATLGRLEEGAAHAEGAPLPNRIEGIDAALHPWGVLAPAPAADGPRTVFVVLVPSDEPAAALFHGAEGAAWTRLAAQPGTGVVALEVAHARPETLRRALAFAGARAKLVVVAVGDAAPALFLALAGGEGGVELDGAVLVSGVERPGPLSRVPRVLLVVTGGAPAGEEPAGMTRVTVPDLALLGQLGLAERVAAWWRE